MSDGFDFFKTSMPDSRPADYYLGCHDGSVYLDFNKFGNLICLRRISFDGYGCCNVDESAIPLNEEDSNLFKKILESKFIDQNKLAEIIKKTIKDNLGLLWADALEEYGFLH